MEIVGLVNNITEATTSIDFGRKGFATRGKAEEGRISYETGIEKAMTTFQEAHVSADPQAMLLSEYTFITQELQFCEKKDKDSINSLTKAIQNFDDAFLALQAVVEPAYSITDKTYPHNGTYRVNGLPKDAFHTAFISHKTRLKNILRAPGIDPIEKSLLKQRFTNLSAAQAAYGELQKKAMGL